MNTFVNLFQQVALEKVFNFATTNIFETRVSGRMVADMCRAASKVSLLDARTLPASTSCTVLAHLIFILTVLCFSVPPCRVTQDVCAALL